MRAGSSPCQEWTIRCMNHSESVMSISVQGEERYSMRGEGGEVLDDEGDDEHGGDDAAVR
eukprot:gene16868-biopygen9350